MNISKLSIIVRGARRVSKMVDKDAYKAQVGIMLSVLTSLAGIKFP